MVTRRMIAIVLVKDSYVVETIEFKIVKPVASLINTIKFLNDWGDVDEISIIDISNEKNKFYNDTKILKKITTLNKLPLSVGGGISNINIAKKLISNGVDKLIINKSALDKELIEKISYFYGSQAIILSLDFFKNQKNSNLYLLDRKNKINIKIIDIIEKYNSMPVGEFLFQSILCDGTKNGYAIKEFKILDELSEKPIIAVGGLGIPDHACHLLRQTNVSAFGIGNYLHHYEEPTYKLKQYIRDKGFLVR